MTLVAREAWVSRAAAVPVPECLACGACCFSELEDYVRVSGDDYARLAERAEELVQFDGVHAHMRMIDGHCVALLVHEGSGQFECGAYATRPQICRDLARCSGQCEAEREAKAARPALALLRARGQNIGRQFAKFLCSSLGGSPRRLYTPARCAPLSTTQRSPRRAPGHPCLPSGALGSGSRPDRRSRRGRARHDHEPVSGPRAPPTGKSWNRVRIPRHRQLLQRLAPAAGPQALERLGHVSDDLRERHLDWWLQRPGAPHPCRRAPSVAQPSRCCRAREWLTAGEWRESIFWPVTRGPRRQLSWPVGNGVLENPTIHS